MVIIPLWNVHKIYSSIYKEFFGESVFIYVLSYILWYTEKLKYILILFYV